MPKVKTMEDLVNLVEEFSAHARKMRWDDPKVARGSCDLAARQFASYASNARVQTKTFRLDDPSDITALAKHLDADEKVVRRRAARDAKKHGAQCNFHDVAVVSLDDGSKVTIDWTARQYGANQPFPRLTVKKP